MRLLVERGQELEAENSKLQADLEASNQQVHALDERLLAVNQLRQDAVKRVDDLISQIDQIGERLDAEAEARQSLDAGESPASVPAPGPSE